MASVAHTCHAYALCKGPNKCFFLGAKNNARAECPKTHTFKGGLWAMTLVVVPEKMATNGSFYTTVITPPPQKKTCGDS